MGHGRGRSSAARPLDSGGSEYSSERLLTRFTRPRGKLLGGNHPHPPEPNHLEVGLHVALERIQRHTERCRRLRARERTGERGRGNPRVAPPSLLYTSSSARSRWSAGLSTFEQPPHERAPGETP
jgi:hypothetical protein